MSNCEQKLIKPQRFGDHGTYEMKSEPASIVVYVSSQQPTWMPSASYIMIVFIPTKFGV